MLCCLVYESSVLPTPLNLSVIFIAVVTKSVLLYWKYEFAGFCIFFCLVSNHWLNHFSGKCETFMCWNLDHHVYFAFCKGKHQRKFISAWCKHWITSNSETHLWRSVSTFCLEIFQTQDAVWFGKLSTISTPQNGDDSILTS